MLIPMIAASMAACAGASAHGPSRAAACTLKESDSTYLQGGAVYRDCAVEHRAQVIDRSARLDFQPSAPLPGGQACYNADIEFVVDTAGAPEIASATVLRTNNPDYAVAALRAVARWRYKPADIRGVPVRQIVDEKLRMAAVIVMVRAGDIPRPPARGPVC